MNPTDPETLRWDTHSIWDQRLYVGPPAMWMAPMVSNYAVNNHFARIRSRRDAKSIYHLPFFLRDRNFTGDVYFPEGGYYGSAPWPPSEAFHARGFVPLARGAHRRDAQIYRLDVQVYHMAAPAWTYSKDKEFAQPDEDAFFSMPFLLETPRQQRFLLHAPTAEETALEASRAAFSDTPRHNVGDAAAGRIELPPSPPPPVFIPPTPVSGANDSELDFFGDCSSSSGSESPSSLEAPTDPRAPTPVRYIPALPLRFPALFRRRDSTASVHDSELSDPAVESEVSDTESEWEEWDGEEATMAMFFRGGDEDDAESVLSGGSQLDLVEGEDEHAREGTRFINPLEDGDLREGWYADAEDDHDDGYLREYQYDHEFAAESELEYL